MNNRKVGGKAESLAQKFLEKKGLEILHKNWNCRWGEIDLIAKDLDDLVFVEVKYTQSTYFGDPSQKVNRKKLYSLKRSINIFLNQYTGFHKDIRLDVISITGRFPDVEINHYNNVTLYG